MNELGKGIRSGARADAYPSRPAIYQALFDNPDLCVYLIEVLPDGRFRFMDANAAIAPFLIDRAASVSGRAPFDCLVETAAACLEKNLRLCIEQRERRSYQELIALPVGTIACATTLTPIADADGRIAHIVGTTRDRTFESRLLDAVGQRASLMVGVDAISPDIIYLFDVRNLCNRYVGGANMLGYDAEDYRRMGSELVTRLIHPDDLAGNRTYLEQLRTLRDGDVVENEYRMQHKDGHYVHLVSRDTVFGRDENGAVELVLGVATDISDRKSMEAEVRLLSDQLLTMQSDERRRIARELHDSTGQHLIAADLALTRIQSANAARAFRGRHGIIEDALSDAKSELSEAKREIRILTFLLHPPSLEALGLPEALRAFVDGFGARAGIEIDLDVDAAGAALGEPIALALFRACQEALTNVYRHAEARSVRIALKVGPSEAALVVADDGVGLGGDGASVIFGVGLSGMRERVQRLGGTLALAGAGGTQLEVRLPI